MEYSMKLLKSKVLTNGQISLELSGIGDCSISTVFTINELLEFIDWKNSKDPESVEEVDSSEYQSSTDDSSAKDDSSESEVK